MAARHEAFDEVSPEVGEFDEEAFSALMAADADAAAALLTDLALATDRELRAAAQRVAARVFVQVGRVGPDPDPRHPPAGRPTAGATATSTWTARWTAGTPAGPSRAEDLVTRDLDRRPPRGLPGRRHAPAR